MALLLASNSFTDQVVVPSLWVGVAAFAFFALAWVAQRVHALVPKKDQDYVSECFSGIVKIVGVIAGIILLSLGVAHGCHGSGGNTDLERPIDYHGE